MYISYEKENMIMNELDKVAELIRNSKNAILLSGAGFSTASNIPDFRSKNGLYSKYPDDILSRKHFYENTDKFYEAFQEKFSAILNATPNAGHLIMAKWQNQGYINEIATQNIDNLHSKAIEQLNISKIEKEKLLKNIYEIHGTVSSYTMKARGKIHKFKIDDILTKEGKIKYRRKVDGVEGTYLVKPDVVLFGEKPLKFGKISKIIKQKTDLMIIAGTSLMVYPFAYLPSYMRKGTNIVIINKTHLNIEGEHVIQIKGDISSILKEIDDKLNNIITR